MLESAIYGELDEKSIEAKDRARLELQEVKQSLKAANRNLRETTIQAIEAFKAHRDHLECRRTEILENLSCQHPHVADDLRQEYQIPDSSRGAHIYRGILFSYKPQYEARSEGVTAPYPSTHLPDNHNISQASRPKAEKVLKSEPDESSLNSSSNTKSTLLDDKPAHSGSRTRTPKLRPLETNRGTIRTSVLRNKSYWIFEHRTINTFGYYILRCPSDDCPNPVFSRDPLREDRATQHLQRCGHPFKDVDDMIIRYARTVITGKRDKGRKREVTDTWARNHNERVLAASEGDLKGEDL